MKILFLCLLCVSSVAALATSVHAAVISTTYHVNKAVPDNDTIGLADHRIISSPGVTEIQGITVSLNFTEGWNGDLYVYLMHDSNSSVLLNRPGRTAGIQDGSSSSGMDINLSDIALADIHTAMPPTGFDSFSGTYQPDGRREDPRSVTDLSPRSAFLSTFVGLDPNGTWSLFVADLSAGETSTLQSWTLNITVIPEPSAAILALLSAVALLRRRR